MAVEAVKAGGLPLIAGAPQWLGSHIWGYVPLVLVTFYVIVAIYRLKHPVQIEEQTGPRAAVAAPPARGQSLEERKNRAVISEMNTARHMAMIAVRHNSIREAEKEWPTMRAALLSAQKQFGMPMPPTGKGYLIDLECGRRMLEKSVPLLESGHVDEALQEAQAFIDRLKPKEA